MNFDEFLLIHMCILINDKHLDITWPMHGIAVLPSVMHTNPIKSSQREKHKMWTKAEVGACRLICQALIKWEHCIRKGICLKPVPRIGWGAVATPWREQPKEKKKVLVLEVGACRVMSAGKREEKKRQRHRTPHQCCFRNKLCLEQRRTLQQLNEPWCK